VKQIQADVLLAHRLLRYLNSPAFLLTAEVRSVRRALMVLEEKQVRKWLALVVMLHAGAAASTGTHWHRPDARALLRNLWRLKVAGGSGGLFPLASSPSSM
jgi:c-di-GMP-related signal transduction protein